MTYASRWVVVVLWVFAAGAGRAGADHAMNPDQAEPHLVPLWERDSLTGGFFGIGSLVDLFTLGGQVKAYNTERELGQMRKITMATAASAQAAAVSAQAASRRD